MVIDNGKKIGFIDGYIHNISAEGASTIVYLSRVLPIKTYTDEFPQHLGRQRPGETEAPVKQRQLKVEVNGQFTLPQRAR
jgi:hypothetical protein